MEKKINRKRLNKRQQANNKPQISKMSHNLGAKYNVIYPRSKRRSVDWCINQLAVGVSYFILLSTTDKSEKVFCFQDRHLLVR